MVNPVLLEKSKGFKQIVGSLSGCSNLSITTDSRKTENKNTFIALYGEKFDGFDFIDALLSESSLNNYIFELKEGRLEQVKKWKEKHPEINFILVENIYSYILNLANVAIIEFKNRGGKVIGLTGSNGKTTNKEILAHLLSEAIGSDKVHYTKGNLNNHIGVPLTIFDIENKHEVAIIEMGTNHPGEIEVLCKAAIPDYGMITNVGYAHIEYLKSLDGVLEEKSALYRCIDKSTEEKKVFILNGYDEKLATLEKHDWVTVVDETNTLIEGNTFEIQLAGSKYKISNPSLLGRHQQINMAMGISLAVGVYPKLVDKIIEAAQSFHLKGMNRGEVREYDHLKVYLDAYNANPSSMMASLSSFESLLNEEGINKSHVMLVLGDMNEIGNQAALLHKETAQKAVEMGFKNLVFVGRYSNSYAEGYPQGKQFKDAAQLSEAFKKNTQEMEFVFIKGSRSLQLESILDIFRD